MSVQVLKKAAGKVVVYLQGLVSSLLLLRL